MGKNPGQKQQSSKPVSRAGGEFRKPACGACGKNTRRMRKSKWSVCESGHKLYRLKGR